MLNKATLGSSGKRNMNMEEKMIIKDLETTSKDIIQNNDSEYV